MKPFTHKNRIGDIFETLTLPPVKDGRELVTRKGATQRQDAVISVLSGRLSLEQIPEFATSLRELLTSTVQLIILDLSRINEFCPNAASVLVNFVSFVEGGGKRLVLFRPSRCVLEALDALHLSHLFDIQQTEDELLLDLPD
ncbi:MAG: STAS domain-containing protein [Deltaproteobacteria bacterium]|nr:STAS domain-containing protein [Deltaproteobacteria bacterium]